MITTCASVNVVHVSVKCIKALREYLFSRGRSLLGESVAERAIDVDALTALCLMRGECDMCFLDSSCAKWTALFKQAHLVASSMSKCAVFPMPNAHHVAIVCRVLNTDARSPLCIPLHPSLAYKF